MRPGLVLALLLAVAGLAAAVVWDRTGRPELWPRAGTEPRLAAVGEPAGGWVEVVIGRPSGAEPRAPVPAPPPPPPPAQQASELPDFELVVQPGQVLSRIVAAHYGTDAEGVLDLVAAYNGLASPDKLQAGSRIFLPEIEKLGASRPPH